MHNKSASGQCYVVYSYCFLFFDGVLDASPELCQVKTEGQLNASASFVAKANPLNRVPHKRKSELHHALCNMLSSILAPLAEGGKNHWPPLGVDPALTLWYEAVARIRGHLMHWMEKQSKHIAVSSMNMIYLIPYLHFLSIM